MATLEKKTEYPTPKEFHDLVLHVSESGTHQNEPIEEYNAFLDNLPREDDTDRFIFYVFSCLLGEPRHGCRFISLMGSCTAWIDYKDYPLEITEEAIRRFGESGWNKKGKYDVGYPRGNSEESGGVENFLVNRLENFIGGTTVERYRKREGLEVNPH